MITIALLTLCLALVALLAYREQAADRERAVILAEADRQRAELLLQTVTDRERLEDKHAEERRELYQRIQAPEIAVAEAHRERRGPYEKRKPAGHDHDIAAARNQEVEGG